MHTVSKTVRHRAIRICLAMMPILVWISGYSVAHAELKLAGIFSDHMVLQRERSVPVWGWADKGRVVTVQFADQSVSAKVNVDGTWQAILKPLAASDKGRDLTAVSESETVVVTDVVVGDVWHASGQSNIAMNVQAVAKHFSQAEADMAAAKLPTIRFRRIDEQESAVPRKDIPLRAGWSVCSPSTVGGFSAAAFYFARKLQSELAVPIGIVDTSRGGTPIEPYIPRAAFKAHPTLLRELELGDQEDLLGIWKLPGGVRARDANWLPGRLFHSRLAPINRFAVRGAIWYQGESNCGDGEDPRDYRHKMRALITGWRTELGNDALPFYFVQLPGSGARASWPYLREQQRLSLGLPHSGMAVTIDLFHEDIHPPNKFDVGGRLARLALADEYGRKVPHNGPLFERAEIADGRAVVFFAHAESGLMTASKDGLAEPKEEQAILLTHFELADQEGTWHPADATIDGAKVIVRNERLSRPAAVRYAYAINPQQCRLYNRDGLPAAPFCSHPELLKVEPELPRE
jgi:sialate O-acetylesterase